MSKRAVHLVGSYPADTVATAMRTIAATAGTHLHTLPDGEVGERRNWILNIVESFRERSDVRLRSDGHWSSYNDRPSFAMKRGARLHPDTINLGRLDAARESYPAFQDIRCELGLPNLGFQIGIPGDLDLALFVFGPARAFSYRKQFRDRLVVEMTTIAEQYGDDVLLQLELPVELVMVATMPPPLRNLAARFMAAGVIKLANAAPAGTRFGVHLCLGDLNNQALKRVGDTGPIAELATQLARRWPSRQRLEYIHVPFAAGNQPPPTDPSFYRPLRRLTALPTDLRMIAGIAHERQELDQQRKILDTVETTVGRPVDVSTACGLGRRTPDTATQLLTRLVTLADS